MKRYLILGLSIILCLSFQEFAFSINPDKEYILTPDSVNWQYDNETVTTSDGYELNTWVYAPNKKVDKNTVLILAYTDAGNMSYWVYHAWMLTQAGYTVVTFDYRGFGKSQDFEIDPNHLYYKEFSTDLTAIVKYTSKRFQNQKIGIWGVSMGTIVTARTYPTIRNDIDFIIGEAFVTNTSQIIERYSQRGKRLILPEKSSVYSETISTIDQPILILSASEDTITTTKDAEQLKHLLGQKCEVIEYQGEHVQGFQYQIDGKGFGGWYVEQINSFVSKIN